MTIKIRYTAQNRAGILAAMQFVSKDKHEVSAIRAAKLTHTEVIGTDRYTVGRYTHVPEHEAEDAEEFVYLTQEFAKWLKTTHPKDTGARESYLTFSSTEETVLGVPDYTAQLVDHNGTVFDTLVYSSGVEAGRSFPPAGRLFPKEAPGAIRPLFMAPENLGKALAAAKCFNMPRTPRALVNIAAAFHGDKYNERYNPLLVTVHGLTDGAKFEALIVSNYVSEENKK